MTDEEKVKQVTAKLTGWLYVGAPVTVHRTGKRGVVHRIRDSGRGWKWVRVKFPSTNGHWEYTEHDLCRR